MTSILSFIFVLGILVFIHELGHFLVAKKAGIRCEKFSLGFPPYIFQKTWGETTYCIGIIPLGGFVKMAGENPDQEASGAPDEFMSKTVLQRMAVIFAGPFMNYALAIFILFGIFLFSGVPVTDPDRSLVGAVMEDSPAEKAGLQEGDQVIAVDGETVTGFESMRDLISPRVKEELEITYVRGIDTIATSLTTDRFEQPRIDGGVDSIGRIGVGQKIVRVETFGFVESFDSSLTLTHRMVGATIGFLKLVVTGQASAKMIGGPVFIAQQSGREASKGAASLFFFMALLSINLAILNILPIPVLDGGHLLFLLVEAVKRKPVSMKIRLVSQQVGVALLLSLIVFVTYNDIARVIQNW